MAHSRDVWRVRTVKLDEFEVFDFEQHEDILYRNPEPDDIEILVNWRVDIVGISDGQVRRSFQFGEDAEGARVYAREIRGYLDELAPAQFADRYMVSL